MNWLSKLRRHKRQLPDAVDMTTFQPSPPSGYLVGGAVRDTLLQRPLKDLDWLVPDAREAALEVADRLQAAVFPLDEERGHWRVLHRSRSEERRVGKEWSARGWAAPWKKKR